MKSIQQRESMPGELVLAIGLIWGHLKTRQFDQAYALAQGCLKLWPNDPQLTLLSSYAAVETGHALPEPTAALLNKKENMSWASRILRRLRKSKHARENAQ